MDELAGFDWRRTRFITLTVNPSLFSSGKQAHEWINTHKAIPGLIRNIGRGKREKHKDGLWIWKYRPQKITKWKWFLEWHKNGFPHYHLFVEVEDEGRAGMIGQEALHHYWLGCHDQESSRVHETFIKSAGSWRDLTGYFQKNGYFEKEKKHQGRLPKWALDLPPNNKIRRSGSNCKKKSDPDQSEYFHKKSKCEVVDIKTGEIIRLEKAKREAKKRTYRAILKSCGEKTRVKINGNKGTVVAVVDVPYKDLRGKLPGKYHKGLGYAFHLTGKQARRLLKRVLHVELVIWSAEIEWILERVGLFDHKWKLKVQKEGGNYA